jgi:hypothetical protein
LRPFEGLRCPSSVSAINAFRLGGELGRENAVPGTILQENALNQHGRGHIPGVLRLALIPLRGTRAALRMTRYKQFSSRCQTFTKIDLERCFLSAALFLALVLALFGHAVGIGICL